MEIGMRLTQAGKRVLAQGLIGKEIHFSCVKIGSGAFDYETESVYELEDLRKYEMTLPLTAKEIRGDGTVYIEAYLSNAEVTKGFACTEHGVFALDQETGAEILYAYVNVGNDYDFIPSNSGPAHKNIYLEYVTEIQDAENVTATLDLSVAYISREEFKNHVESAHPHLNTPNHYLDVDEASELWAADRDNHLHKITIDKVKNQMRELVIDKESAPDLGLEANVLMYDDDGAFTDLFTVKVTSSAENGLLIGLESVEGLRSGAVYTISDGVNQESVRIASVRYNLSGYHAKLAGRLDKSYDWNSTYLYRTTKNGAEKKSLTWRSDGFRGVEANISRVINLTEYEIAGDARNEGGKLFVCK